MNPLALHFAPPADDAYGPLLKPGLVVQLSSPEISIERLRTVPAAEIPSACRDVVHGIRVGHASELESLGFFDVVEEQVGSAVRPGQEGEVSFEELPTLVAILAQITPQATSGVRCLISRLTGMAERSAQERCNLGFML
jgi:hypothetical protein